MFQALSTLSQSLSNSFGSKTLIDTNHAHWLEDTFDWCLEHFDAEEFQRCQLVQPSNEFFPGRVSSVEEKAALILEQTQGYAGLSQWPTQLQAPNQIGFANALPQLDASLLARNSNAESSATTVIAPDYRPQQQLSLPILYLADQTLKPTDLAASYAHQLAQHLIQQKQILPPGGPELLSEAAEVLAVFMGFGVLLVNSAHTFRGGCGSCYNARANRSAQLSENQIIYALALFAKHKQLDDKRVLSHVKKHLHGNYRAAKRQIQHLNINP